MLWNNPRKFRSQYRGVTWHKGNAKWYARIKIGPTMVEIGYFDLELEAAKAYNLVARELHGPDARLNVFD